MFNRKKRLTSGVNLVIAALSVAIFVGVLIQVAPVSAGAVQANSATSATWNPSLGWDFECHTNTHPSLISLTDSQIRAEYQAVNDAFAAHGYPAPQHTAYPYGDYDSRVMSITAEYRKSGRTVWGNMMTYPVANWYEVLAAQLVWNTTLVDIKGWVSSCVASNALLVIFTHDVSATPSEYGCTPAILTQMLDYLVQQQNSGKLTVMTMAQAYDYWSTATSGKATVVVCFDDANESDYLVVYPLFVARGLKGTSYIVTSVINDSGQLSWAEIAKMRAPRTTYAVHLASAQNSNVTVNLGTITFDGTSYNLPKDISKAAAAYQALYAPASGYAFDHWETTGGLTVSSATVDPTTVTVKGAGTLRGVYKVYTPVLFTDGFESGTFGAWSSKVTSSGETATVVSTLPHQGVYSAKFTSNGNLGFEYSYCYKTVTSSADLYSRGFFYVSQSGITGNNIRFYLIILRAGGNPVAYAGWRMVGGVLRWDLLIRQGTGYAEAYSSTSPVLNKWYNVQLHWKNGATSGVGELWVDGTLVCSMTGRNTSTYGNATAAQFGLAELYNCGPTSVYCDDCTISKTKI